MENEIPQEQYTDEEEGLSSYIETLNPAVQNLLSSDQTSALINSIADETNLTEEETQIFGNEVHLALMGFGNPINFSENLIQEGMPSDKAANLTALAEAKIFSQVKNVLKKLYSEESPQAQSLPPEETPIITAPPAPETRPIEPFIRTADATSESVHTLDREALLRELESPEPYHVPFIPQRPSFEEKMVHPQTPPPPTSEAPISSASRDPYREEPEL